MKWWQKKIRGWTVPFWYTDAPLVSKQTSIILSNSKDAHAMTKAFRSFHGNK